MWPNFDSDDLLQDCGGECSSCFSHRCMNFRFRPELLLWHENMQARVLCFNQLPSILLIRLHQTTCLTELACFGILMFWKYFYQIHVVDVDMKWTKPCLYTWQWLQLDIPSPNGKGRRKIKNFIRQTELIDCIEFSCYLIVGHPSTRSWHYICWIHPTDRNDRNLWNDAGLLNRSLHF